MEICIREPLLYNIAAKQNIHKGSLMLKELNITRKNPSLERISWFTKKSSRTRTKNKRS